MDHTPRQEPRPLIGLVLGALLAALAACGPAPQGEGAESPAKLESAVTPRDAQGPAGGPQAGDAAGATVKRSPPGPPPLVPKMSLEGEQGEKLDGAAFEPARERMKECVPGQRGVVQVRIRTDPARTSMDVEPSTSLGSATRRCVLETLSTIDVDEALRQSSPSDRPSKGFNSVMRLEW